jgi:hypothetical protein
MVCLDPNYQYHIPGSREWLHDRFLAFKGKNALEYCQNNPPVSVNCPLEWLHRWNTQMYFLSNKTLTKVMNIMNEVTKCFCQEHANNRTVQLVIDWAFWVFFALYWEKPVNIYIILYSKECYKQDRKSILTCLRLRDHLGKRTQKNCKIQWVGRCPGWNIDLQTWQNDHTCRPMLAVVASTK